MEVDLQKLPAKTLYSMARNRRRYGSPDRIDTYVNNSWFVEPVFKHLSGKKPRWGWSTKMTDEERPFAEKSVEVMREFCRMSDQEVEGLLVARSTLDATKYSISIKGGRLHPEVEKVLLERCKGKKSRMSALLTYCGKWEIMPENMTEITMVAGFEGGRRGRIGTEFMKKLAANKRKCKDLLAQIMKLEGIGEDEPIKRIMERLG